MPDRGVGADPAMIVYGVLPYTAVDADRVIEQLWVLAGLEVRQADEDLVGAERVRQTFGFIVEAARARHAAGPARSAGDRARDREVAVARPAQGAAPRPRLVRGCDRRQERAQWPEFIRDDAVSLGPNR